MYINLFATNTFLCILKARLVDYNRHYNVIAIPMV